MQKEQRTKVLCSFFTVLHFLSHFCSVNRLYIIISPRESAYKKRGMVMIILAKIAAVLAVVDIIALIWMHALDSRCCAQFDLNDYRQRLDNATTCKQVYPIKNAYQAGRQALEVWVDHALAQGRASDAHRCPQWESTCYDPQHDCWLVRYRACHTAPTQIPTIIIHSNGEVLAAYDL